MSSGGEDRESGAAGLLATAAGCGADAAVLMVMSVPLALLSAGTARHRARLDRSADDAEIRFRLTCDDAAGGVARIGTVETEANAADQFRDVALTEARVGAARARCGAVEAVLDAAQEHLAIDAGRARMRLEHLLNGHGVSLLFGEDGLTSAAPRGPNQR
jgi:hypothetical protein